MRLDQQKRFDKPDYRGLAFVIGGTIGLLLAMWLEVIFGLWQ